MNSGSGASDERAHVYLVLEFQEAISKIHFDPDFYKHVRTMLCALEQRDSAIAILKEFRRGAIQKYIDHHDTEFTITHRRPRLVPPTLLDGEPVNINSGGVETKTIMESQV